MGRYSKYRKFENTLNQQQCVGAHWGGSSPLISWKRGWKGCLSSIDPNTSLAAISISLKNSRNECLKMQEASKACRNQEKWSTWNGVSIVVATLDFIIITYIRLHI